jgi:hypothetical protein
MQITPVMRVFAAFVSAVGFGSILAAQTRSASIAGRVQDITRAAIAGVHAELRLASEEGRVFSTTTTDADGMFEFRNLPPENYALRLISPGFKWLTIKSIYVVDGEHKALPVLELSISEIASCGGRAVLDYMRLLTPGDSGNVGGTVHIDLGPLVGNSPPVQDAEVVLLCSGATPCRTTKTDAQGRFLFAKFPAGNHGIRASHADFYAAKLPGYIAQDGRELVYSPLYIERCFKGDCDPAKRPKKPLGICE